MTGSAGRRKPDKRVYRTDQVASLILHVPFLLPVCQDAGLSQEILNGTLDLPVVAGFGSGPGVEEEVPPLQHRS